MAFSASSMFLACLILLIFYAHPTHAFGAGNIGSTSKIEGQNWRHGDIEDTLLTLLISRAAGGKKFGKLDVKRVYFGNWLRDYSQAVDVGTVKYVSAEAIRIILWVLGFMSFGYGTHEFEVTTQRLGCYRPEEHIDNPKDYADNEDARQYDRRLRGPVDERRELSIDPETGLKMYIASERAGITTSAGLVRNLFGRSIQLGRQYARSRNNADLYEALRLLGTGCHCLEDFSAHSNYTELALIELGERNVFPHVGRRTQIQVRGARHEVYPCVTGTFGGVDFLHSVMGEFDDKATQSEIQELEGTLQNSQDQGDTSVLQDLLNKVPDGIFGGKDQAGKANELQSNAQAHQMQNARISPRQPEEWTRYLMDVQQQILPIIEWHDEIMKSITETIEKIPILPDLIEQLQDQLNMFVFSLLAPFVVPIINQVKAELNTGSSEIIKSSVEKQHVVFRDDRSTDPTHSMLSKDHFSNVLNEPAGKVASQVLKWVVPQVINAWDDERVDVDRTLTRIVNGVLHHPALRSEGNDGTSDGRRLMFGVVEKWWGELSQREKDGLREQLSREGVESGRNHKPGVHDKGHGCGKPLGMPNLGTAQSSGAMGGLGGAAALGGLSSALGGGGGGYGGHGGGGDSTGLGKMAGEAVGGGALGGIVGGIVGGIGGDLLGGAFGEKDKKSYKHESYGQGGEHTTSYGEVGESGGRYGQAEYRTQDTGYGHKESYQRYERDDSGGYGGSYESRETRQTSGGYQQSYEQSYQTSGGGYQTETRREETTHRGGYGGGELSSSQYRQKKDSDSENDYDSDSSKKKKKHQKKEKKYGKRGSDDSDSDDNKRKSYGRQEYGSGGYGGRQQETSYGSEGGGYGRQEEYASGGGYGGRREQESTYGSSGGGYGGGGYGRSEYSGGGGNEGYGRQEGYGHGSGGGGGGGGYGSSGFGEERREGYGGGGYGSSGYGEERREGYGGGSGEYGRGEDEYGERGGGYGECRGYGESGGYGGPGEYGERREYGDDY